MQKRLVGTFREDLTGLTFNNLTVVKPYLSGKKKPTLWECLCGCGKTTIVDAYKLKTGLTKSCGCLKLSYLRKHGHTSHKGRSKEYSAWNSMINRCGNPLDPKYKDYGERGIIVCERWVKSFSNFISDMGCAPTKKHSIDRINNDGNYEPSNCRWATKKEQGQNRRNNVWLEHNGKKMILADWSKELEVQSGSITTRLKRGETFEFIYNHYKNRIIQKRNLI